MLAQLRAEGVAEATFHPPPVGKPIGALAGVTFFPPVAAPSQDVPSTQPVETEAKALRDQRMVALAAAGGLRRYVDD